MPPLMNLARNPIQRNLFRLAILSPATFICSFSGNRGNGGSSMRKLIHAAVFLILILPAAAPLFLSEQSQTTNLFQGLHRT